MPISVECGCGRKLKAKNESAGRVLNCPACNSPLTIPTLDSSQDPFVNPMWTKPNLVDQPSAEPKKSREWAMWTGLAASLVVVAVGLVLFFNKHQRDAANREVARLVGAAKEARDRKQWDDAIGSLKQALETRNATEMDDTKRLLVETEDAKAKVEADKLLAAAHVALDAKRLPEAVRLLNAYQANPHATKGKDAADLLQTIAYVTSDPEAATFLQQVKDEDLEAFQNGNSSKVTVYLSKTFQEIHAETLLRQLPAELRRREAARREQEAIELAAKQDAQRRFEAEELASRQAAKVRQDAEEERTKAAAGTQQPTYSNGTADFKRISEFPENHVGKWYIFAGLYGSPTGNLRRDKEKDGFAVAFTCARKYVAAFINEDTFAFVVPNAMAEKLLSVKDGEFFSKVYCQIIFLDPQRSKYPVGLIYRVEFYDNNQYAGRPIVVE